MDYDITVEVLLTKASIDGIVVARLPNGGNKGGGVGCTAVKMPRQMIASCNRQDVDGVGIYLLFGKNSKGSPAVFIGRSGSVMEHVLQLDKGRGGSVDISWDIAVCIVRTGMSGPTLDHLAFRIVRAARFHKRYEVSTDISEPRENLGNERAERRVAERVRDITTLLDVLGFRVLSAPPEKGASAVPKPTAGSVATGKKAVATRQDPSRTTYVRNVPPKPANQTIFVCSGSGGADAKGWPIMPRGDAKRVRFVVLKGSMIARYVNFGFESSDKSDYDLRQQLIHLGVIRDWMFQYDCWFSSPSSAASVVLGHMDNGRDEWSTTKGLSLNEYIRRYEHIKRR